jgi:hypothetical protein
MSAARLPTWAANHRSDTTPCAWDEKLTAFMELHRADAPCELFPYYTKV